MAKGIKRITRKLLKSDTCSELMSFLLYLYTKFVYYTTLWNKDELSRLYQVWTENDSIILISWHGRATMAPCFWDHQRPMNALVSLHNDGKLMARLLEHFGLGIFELICATPSEVVAALRRATNCGKISKRARSKDSVRVRGQA